MHIGWKIWFKSELKDRFTFFWTQCVWCQLFILFNIGLRHLSLPQLVHGTGLYVYICTTMYQSCTIHFLLCSSDAFHEKENWVTISNRFSSALILWHERPLLTFTSFLYQLSDVLIFTKPELWETYISFQEINEKQHTSGNFWTTQVPSNNFMLWFFLTADILDSLWLSDTSESLFV